MSPGKITELLASGVLDSSTVLVLINAIYFKGNWDKQFELEATVDAQFRINKVKKKKRFQSSSAVTSVSSRSVHVICPLL